jgi:hypothetical protein
VAKRAPLLVAGLSGLALIVASVIGGTATRDRTVPAAEAYTVAYRIEDRAGEEHTVRSEVVEVRRPYDGRLEAADGSSSSGRLTNREFQWQLSGGEKPRFGFRRTPGGPVRDVSFGALKDAAAAGVIDVAGEGEALGRPCTWFALQDPLPARLGRATAASLVEACVDPAGILLREIWTIDGRVVRIVEATDVDLRAGDNDDFLYGIDPEDEEVTDEDVAELLRSQSVVADEVPTPNVPIGIEPPRGWKIDRRSVIVEGGAGGSRPGQTASDTYVRGPSLVVFERALREGDEPVWPTGEGDPIDVGIGTGRVLWFGDRVELRITVAEGFARLFAPDLRTARAFAERLRVRD